MMEGRMGGEEGQRRERKVWIYRKGEGRKNRNRRNRASREKTF